MEANPVLSLMMQLYQTASHQTGPKCNGKSCPAKTSKAVSHLVRAVLPLWLRLKNDLILLRIVLWLILEPLHLAARHLIYQTVSQSVLVNPSISKSHMTHQHLFSEAYFSQARLPHHHYRPRPPQEPWPLPCPGPSCELQTLISRVLR